MSLALAIIGIIAAVSGSVIGIVLIYYVIDDILCCDQHKNKERRV